MDVITRRVDQTELRCILRGDELKKVLLDAVAHEAGVRDLATCKTRVYVSIDNSGSSLVPIAEITLTIDHADKAAEREA